MIGAFGGRAVLDGSEGWYHRGGDERTEGDVESAPLAPWDYPMRTGVQVCRRCETAAHDGVSSTELGYRTCAPCEVRDAAEMLATSLIDGVDEVARLLDARGIGFADARRFPF